MNKILKRSLSVLGIALTAILIFAGYNGYQLAAVGAGYMAKMMCSHVFISGMEPDKVAREDVYDPILEWFSYTVDYPKRSVTVSAPLGLISRTAHYRPCLGAVLALSQDSPLISESNLLCKADPDTILETRSWPLGSRVDLTEVPENVDRDMLKRVIDETFTEPDPHYLRRTRAVVVVYKGKIIAEQYAAPIDETPPLIGWSMTKSITNALIGILIGQGKLGLNQTFTLNEWQDAGDPRRAITLEQMLRMSSGLAFDESYGNPLSDVVEMLFNSISAAHFAAAKPLDDPPGSRWYYSSGTTNIISQIIRRTFKDDDQAYLRFPFISLFHKIGMNTAVMETDPSGTFVGSSFAYATARDWARFGLLYLQDGIWNGERLLPEGWVAFSSKRTTISRKGRYAAHFWLPAIDEENADLKGMYYASGHDGQYVTIVPVHDLVVVRLGLSKQGGWDQQQFIMDIIRTFE